MSKTTLVYAHGWALENWFWGPLRNELAEWEALSWDFNYFGSGEVECGLPEGPWVGIGHSLGFRKLVETDLDRCQGLVSLSGFFDFCGEGGTSPRIVQRMVKQFGSDPQPVLDRFYENCGFPQKPEAPSNTAALERDLKLLLDQDFNEGPESGISRWKGIQVFAIAGGQDKIVPHKLALRQFNNLTLCPDASHSLGFEKSEWCAEQIRRFLDSL